MNSSILERSQSANAAERGKQTRSKRVTFRPLRVPEDRLFDPMTEYLTATYSGQLRAEELQWRRQASSTVASEREEAIRNLARLKELETKLFNFLHATLQLPLHKVYGSARDHVAQLPGMRGTLAAYQAFLDLSVPDGLGRCCGGGPGYMEATLRAFLEARKSYRFTGSELVPRNVSVRLGAFDTSKFGEPPPNCEGLWRESDLVAPPHRFLGFRTDCLMQVGQTVLNIVNPGGLGSLKEVFDLMVGDQLKHCVWSFAHERPVADIVLLDGTVKEHWFWNGFLQLLIAQEEAGAITLAKQQPITILRPDGAPIASGIELGGICGHFLAPDVDALEEVLERAEWKNTPIRVVYANPEVCGLLMHRLAVAKYLELERFFSEMTATPEN